MIAFRCTREGRAEERGGGGGDERDEIWWFGMRVTERSDEASNEVTFVLSRC